MRKIINSYITVFCISISMLFLFVSCEKEVDIPLRPSEPQIVIEGTIASDSLAKIKITKSKNFDQDNTYQPITDAVVVLSDNAGSTDTLEVNAEGFFVSKTLRGVQGYTYNLQIDVEGKRYTSTSTMPALVPIKDLFFVYYAVFDAAFPTISFNDPAGVPNFYRYILTINSRRIKNIYVDSDENRDGISPFTSLLSFGKDDNDGEFLKQGDIVKVEMQSIDEGVYNFFETLSRIENSLGNPKSNIKGGALGYFSAYSFDVKEAPAMWLIK